MKAFKTFLPALIALVVMLAAYGFGVAYASDRFLPGSHIGELDVSGKEAWEVQELLDSEPCFLTVTQLSADGEEAVTQTLDLRSKLGFHETYDIPALLKKQNPWLWFIHMFGEKSLDAGEAKVSYNEGDLAGALAELYCMQPENRTVKLPESSESGEGAALYGELNAAGVQNALNSAIKNRVSSLDLYGAGLYTPVEQNEASQEASETQNRILQKTVTVNLLPSAIEVQWEEAGWGEGAPERTAVLQEGVISELVTFDSGQPQTDAAKIRAFLAGVTSGQTEFDSREMVVDEDHLAVDHYELNLEASRKALEIALLSTRNEEVDLVWDVTETIIDRNESSSESSDESSSEESSSEESLEESSSEESSSEESSEESSSEESSSEESSTGESSEESFETAEGETYIDVNISEQLCRYYVNGEVVFTSPVVTGQSGSSDTPTGTFMIRNMEDVWTRGSTIKLYPSAGGVWEVNYWMGYDPETNGDMYALHDAPWRNGEFGGDIYTYDGSHGCINMPTEKAAELYGMIEYGTTVYIHY